MKLLFEFTTACPKYKNKVISLNNVGEWIRYSSSKIKNEYKDILKEWNIPTATKQYEKLHFEFHLYRHNKRILDSDALGFIVKWTIDAVKESEWLIDDNQVSYLVEPAILNRDLVETEILVKVYEK
jgi:hypothetical protein